MNWSGFVGEWKVLTVMTDSDIFDFLSRSGISQNIDSLPVPGLV